MEHDWRNIENGRAIPSEGYCDQAYVVHTDDGHWLCVMTTGPGVEGEPGQHIIACRSADQGRTWDAPVALEPRDGVEASYAVPLKTPGGRVYAFYNHNTDNSRKVRADKDLFPDGYCRRVDSLGYFVFKYSDDHGRTWSDRRYPVPVREMDIDRENAYTGKIRFFWNVGRPLVHHGAAYVPLHKVGGFGKGFFTRTEGVFLRSDNILTERDPEKIVWETLPEGPAGLRAVSGAIAEEHSLTALSDGTLYCVYRTVAGHPCHAFSLDDGRTWSEPAHMTHRPGGRRIKNPRAANFVWRTQDGHYLYWFHNHARLELSPGWEGYAGRNPVWVCGGIERDGHVEWSEPEILLYSDLTHDRMSYPDLVEENGEFFVTETQKETARVHAIPRPFLDALWRQDARDSLCQDGLVCALRGEPGLKPGAYDVPALRDVGETGGFALECCIRFNRWAPFQIILDTRVPNGHGMLLATTDRHTLKLCLADGKTESAWESDSGLFQPGRWHHVGIVIDYGPKLILFIVDETLCDGGDERQFGWGRFHPDLGNVHSGRRLHVASDFRGEVHAVRIYDRPLLCSEMIGNQRATAKALHAP